MGELFHNSVSGLLAFQRALNTTAHNIANVNTEGYSRQRVELGTLPALGTGSGFIGSGVQTESVRRVFSQARETAVQRNSAELQRLSTFSELATRLDNLLADQAAGLSPALQDFFDAVQDVANDPISSTSRQMLLSSGENLVARLNFLDDRFSALKGEVESQMRLQVDEVNQIAATIAELNEAIVTAQGRIGHPPNDLLDQRDALTLDLSERVATRVVAQDNGAVNVFIGNGQTLVAGFESNELRLIGGADDPTRPEIAIANPGGTATNITATIEGGSLGGLLDARRELIGPARDELGRIAASIAVAFNNQHKLGMQYAADPGGALGGDFFGIGAPQVVSHLGNAGAQPSVRFSTDKIGELKASNYRLQHDGSNWQLTRLADGQVVDSGTGLLEADGLSLDVSGLSAGDRFLIRPTQNAVDGMSVLLDRPSQVAAASPLIVSEATAANGQASNGGTAQISGLAISSTDNLPPGSSQAPFTLTYDATATEFQITDAAGNAIGTIDFDAATDAEGIVVDAGSSEWTAAGSPSLLEYGDMRFEISGVPENGDQFIIARNENGLGDNRNMLTLGELAGDSIMDGGSATVQEAYAGLVGEIGTATLRAGIDRDAQQAVLDQAIAANQAVSGVNLEEEAANLLKFQKAYQASAQAIAIANTLFDSLLSAVRG
ncbi:MAG: flagellar hook-associated protein FlgK [Nitrococcus sp.]|nr:flagellar hook-associated protein FlgK [Nitrococcus sp.]